MKPFIAYPHEIRNALANGRGQFRRPLTQRNSEPGAGTYRTHDYDFTRGWADPGLGSGGYLKAPFKLKGEDWEEDPQDDTVSRIYPKVRIGDWLWVRETWMYLPIDMRAKDHKIVYKDGSEKKILSESDATVALGSGMARISFGSEFSDYDHGDYGVWKSSSQMPRCASRLTLRVTGVRVERLQEINGSDALAEGVTPHAGYPIGFYEMDNQKALDSIHCAVYRDLWESIHGKGSWSANPWVTVYEFEVVK